MSSGTGMSAALLLFFYIFPNPAHHLARAAAVWGAFLWAPCNPWCIGITTAFSGTNLCTPCNPWRYRYACAHRMALRFLHAFKNVPQFHGNMRKPPQADLCVCIIVLFLWVVLQDVTVG